MKETLLDTDIISFYLKNTPAVVKNLEDYLNSGQTLHISRATFFEIKAGLAYKDAFAKDKKFMELLSKANVLEITESSTLLSAQFYADLRKKGVIIQEMDLLNAGIAIANDLCICTNNTKHYQPIETLELINWAIE